MLKVYLETTIFNRFFEENSDYYLETKKLFDRIMLNELEAKYE